MVQNFAPLDCHLTLLSSLSGVSNRSRVTVREKGTGHSLIPERHSDYIVFSKEDKI